MPSGAVSIESREVIKDRSLFVCCCRAQSWSDCRTQCVSNFFCLTVDLDIITEKPVVFPLVGTVSVLRYDV